MKDNGPDIIKGELLRYKSNEFLFSTKRLTLSCKDLNYSASLPFSKYQDNIRYSETNANNGVDRKRNADKGREMQRNEEKCRYTLELLAELKNENCL